MNSSPYAAPAEEYYYHHERLSATATPSPRAANGGYYYAGGQTPARPATRAAYGHSRNVSSTAYEFATARPSPRYTSDGYYATANVSGSHSRNHSFSTRSSPPPRPHSVHPVAASSPSQSSSRRDHPSASCFIFGRSSTPHGESDEDEILEVNGRTYIIPAESSSRRRRGSTSRAPPRFYYEADDGERGADYYVSKQGGYAFVVDSARDAAAAAPLYESSGRTRDQPQQASATPRPQPVRRASTSMPVRPQTARPASSGAKKSSASPNGGSASSSNATPKAPKASEADAKKHSIPPGYSLKNWDPTESPILLLGSVFDANSLGKWIYDWTVFAYGPTHPISEIAGDMWLLLIQLAGKIRRADDVRLKVRTNDNRETIDEFLESGERLMQKLRKLLKICEEPMLKSAKKNASLGKAAGIEFVETLFGRDRVLDKTEKFMQGVRTFNLRFDANCDDIIKNPTL